MDSSRRRRSALQRDRFDRLIAACRTIGVGVLNTNELVDALVQAAALITDADASCIALAVVKRVPLLTDNRKEHRIARDLFPPIELVSTLDALADAARKLLWSDTDVTAVASALRGRGNIAPPRNDPRAGSYEQLLRDAK